MVGGHVIGIVRGKETTLLHVEDRRHGRSDRCGVRCVEKRIDNGEQVKISLGDQVWWQSGEIMWTPTPCGQGDRCGIDFDIRLPKVGYSHRTY